MNWSPDHFHLCDDGKWRNAKGVIAVSYSFKELKEKLDENT